MAREIYLAENGQQIGPLSDDDLRAMIEQGKVREGTYAWVEGAPDWRPINELLPEFFAMTIAVSSASFQQYQAAAPAAAQPAPAPAPEPEPEPAPAPSPAPDAAASSAAVAGQPPATTFEIVVSDDHRMPKITLENDSVVVEAGMLHYTLGAVTVEPQPPTSGGLLRTAGPKGARALCRGTGGVFLAPTFGECTVLELAGDEWLLAPGALLACDRTVTLETVANKLWVGVAGDGFALTKVSGQGKVLLHSLGPIERIELAGQTLAVEGDFAIAHSGGLEFRLDKSAQAASDGLLRTFRGAGAVLLAPVPNRFAAVLKAVSH